jgi:hypothetical protein
MSQAHKKKGNDHQHHKKDPFGVHVGAKKSKRAHKNPDPFAHANREESRHQKSALETYLSTRVEVEPPIAAQGDKTAAQTPQPRISASAEQIERLNSDVSRFADLVASAVDAIGQQGLASWAAKKGVPLGKDAVVSKFSFNNKRDVHEQIRLLSSLTVSLIEHAKLILGGELQAYKSLLKKAGKTDSEWDKLCNYQGLPIDEILKRITDVRARCEKTRKDTKSGGDREESAVRPEKESHEPIDDLAALAVKLVECLNAAERAGHNIQHSEWQAIIAEIRILKRINAARKYGDDRTSVIGDYLRSNDKRKWAGKKIDHLLSFANTLAEYICIWQRTTGKEGWLQSHGITPFIQRREAAKIQEEKEAKAERERVAREAQEQAEIKSLLLLVCDALNGPVKLSSRQLEKAVGGGYFAENLQRLAGLHAQGRAEASGLLGRMGLPYNNHKDRVTFLQGLVPAIKAAIEAKQNPSASVTDEQLIVETFCKLFERTDPWSIRSDARIKIGTATWVFDSYSRGTISRVIDMGREAAADADQELYADAARMIRSEIFYSSELYSALTNLALASRQAQISGDGQVSSSGAASMERTVVDEFYNVIRGLDFEDLGSQIIRLGSYGCKFYVDETPFERIVQLHEEIGRTITEADYYARAHELIVGWDDDGKARAAISAMSSPVRTKGRAF